MRAIHVIGGAGGIGRWLIDHILDGTTPIYCYDIDPRALKGLPSFVIPCALTPADGYTSFSENFEANDWVLLAVPPTVFDATTGALKPLLKPRTLMVTLSSVQAEPLSNLKNLQQQISTDITVCGCHPLFGTAVSSPVGQLVALTDFDFQEPEHLEFRRILTRKGLIVSTLHSRDHDRYMSYVQALVHFSLIGFAATLAKEGLAPNELLKLRTPNFQFLYAFACRVLKLSPTTTGSIQSTADASLIRKKMLATLQELHAAFELANTTESSAKVIEAIREPLSFADLDEGAEIAVMAADRLQDFEEILYRYKNNRTPFLFRHRASDKVKIVRITDIRHDEIGYEEATKSVQRAGATYFASGLDDIARANYRSLGLNIPLTVSGAIKKRNIKLLDREELDNFVNTSVLPIVHDHNFTNPHGLSDDFLEQWLPVVVPGLWHCEFRESFRSRELERITMRITINPYCTRSEVVQNIRSVLEGPSLSPVLPRAPRRLAIARTEQTASITG